MHALRPKKVKSKMPSRVTPLEDIVDLGTDGQQHLKEALCASTGAALNPERRKVGGQQQKLQRWGCNSNHSSAWASTVQPGGGLPSTQGCTRPSGYICFPWLPPLLMLTYPRLWSFGFLGGVSTRRNALIITSQWLSFSINKPVAWFVLQLLAS